MIASLIIGRRNSKRLANKNIMMVGGKVLCTYSICASIKSDFIQHTFVSTDCPELKKVSEEMNVSILERPDFLATDEALVEDVVFHGLQEIEKILGRIEILVVLFANVATISSNEIDDGISMLVENQSADSVVTVTEEARYSTRRAKAIENGCIIHNDYSIDSPEYKYFYNGCLWISRADVIKKMNGQPRFKWIGTKILPLMQEFGLDINYEYEILLSEFWLKKTKK